MNPWKAHVSLGLANRGMALEVFPPPAPPLTHCSPHNKSGEEKQVKVHRAVPELRALHLIGLKQHWLLKSLSVRLQSCSLLQVYWLEGAHNSSLLWPLPLRFPPLASGSTDRAWCTTVSIVAEMESWLENSRGSGVKLGLRLCLPGRSSHLSRTGIPRVLPSPLLLANMSKPRPSARSSSPLLASSDSSRGCFRGRPGLLLMTLFPVLACRCRCLARRIFCTCSKFEECILLTSFWICSTSRRLYLRLLGAPGRGESENEWGETSQGK